MLQKPRGTRDFLPEDMEPRRYIERMMRDTAGRWGYREVCTPTFETLELFTMRSGEGIVQEMYVFEDKGGRKLVLRPEITASVLRMYVNEGRILPKPLRWYYFADCYRYERPQKGRYRQFWQFGIECIGADSAAADAEVILVSDEIFRSAGITYDIHVGHLAPMKRLLETVPPDSQRKVMAYLDKRDFDGLRGCLETLGFQDLYLSLASLAGCKTIEEVFEITGDIPEKTRISEMVDILDSTETEYKLNFGIARGLDYYTGMVFEVFAPNLGAENQILGGGAYRLAHLFGGEDVPSCGFAIGFDRVMVSRGDIPLPKPVLVGILYTTDARRHAFRIARQFRDAGIQTEMNLSERGISAQLKQASKAMDYAVILGERESSSGTVTLKNLHTGNQQEYPPDVAIAEVKAFGSC